MSVFVPVALLFDLEVNPGKTKRLLQERLDLGEQGVSDEPWVFSCGFTKRALEVAFFGIRITPAELRVPLDLLLLETSLPSYFWTVATITSWA